MNNLDIQRLVDCECSHQDRADLLASIGDDASLWRRLALRLLEDKVLQRELRNDAAIGQSTGGSDRPKLVRPMTSRWKDLVPALAASVMFLSFGFWSGKHYSIAVSPSVASESKRMDDTLTRFEDLVPTGLMAFDSAGGQDAPFEVPVYEVPRFNPNWLVRQDAEYLSEINSKFVQRGWNASLDTSLYEGELPDGRRMIVPINNVHFEPIGY